MFVLNEVRILFLWISTLTEFKSQNVNQVKVYDMEDIFREEIFLWIKSTRT